MLTITRLTCFNRVVNRGLKMANDFYSDMQGIASALIGEFAQGSVVYHRLTAGGGTPDDPGTASDNDTAIPATVRTVRFQYIDHTNILTTDLMVVMPGGIFEPNIKDFIVVDGVRYKIIRIFRKPAAGIAVSFDIVIRK